MLIDQIFDKIDTLQLEINGVVYDQFLDGTVNRSIENVSGAFEFTATANDVQSFPIKEGDKVRIIYASSSALITGFVTDVNVGYDAGSHTISVSGRDKTGDLVDSSVVGDVQFNAPVRFTDICKRVIANLGADIDVVDNIGGIIPFNANEIVAAEKDMSAFEFLEQYARKRQLLLSSTEDGDLFVTRGGGQIFKTYLINEKGGEQNNIMSANIRYNSNDRFNRVQFISQKNRTASSSTSGATSQKGISFDPSIRVSRQKIVVAESSNDNLTCQQRANWDVNLRRARGIEYTCKVRGFVAQTGTGQVFNTIWKPGLKCFVSDEFCDISSEMLIKAVTYNISTTGGTTCNLTLVSPDAYTPQPVRIDQAINQIGVDLT